MIAWLAANLINIVLILAVAALVFFCVRVMVRDKKAGKASCGGCGGNCASCGCACAGCCACRAQSVQTAQKKA